VPTTVSPVKPQSTKVTISVVVCLILAAALFRVLRETCLQQLPNFSPLLAMAFCGGLLLPGLLGWIFPLAVLLLSELALNLLLNYPPQVAAWPLYLLAVASGRWLAGRGMGLGNFTAVLTANSVIFYIVTNAVSWISEPAYARSLAGLWQCLTVGLPGYPPAWTFFRNSLFSDFLFAGLIMLAWSLAARGREVPLTAARAV